MGDLLIRGMEMPTHCIDCPFMVSRDGDDCILQSAEANANFENWEQMKAGCPLVPVPPHGKCIDADALKESLVFAEKTAEWAVPALRAVLMVIDEMPTIIPASNV